MSKIRPIWNDEMQKELVDFVAKILFEWVDGENDLDECTESTEKVMRHSQRDNGYELARKFEREYFAPDAQLVENLDYVCYETSNILERHIKQWVKDNDIKLALPIGAMVKYKDRVQAEVYAEIVQLYPERAMYGVWYEGHSSKKGSGHTLVTPESITELNKTDNP